MPYLNLHPDFFGHPKCLRLVKLLGARAEVFPIRLWCYTAKYHPLDGHLKGYDATSIAQAMLWSQDPEKLVSALMDCGFLEKTSDGYQIHQWEDHEGHLKSFQLRAMKGAKARWKRYASSNHKAYALSNAKAMLPQVRYSKVKQGSISKVCSDVEFRELLSKTYPLVPLDQEFQKMEAWLAANPLRQKSNYKRFVNNWVSREQRRREADAGRPTLPVNQDRATALRRLEKPTDPNS